MADASHLPVMLPEVLDALQPANDEIYVDATFGAGGYSRAILEAAECKVYAIDRDPNVQEFAKQLQADFPERFIFLAGSFSEMTELLKASGVQKVDGIVMDLGVSSMQLDQAERGFSFMRDGELDMRQSQQGQSAADVVNSMEADDLADILYKYGEERKSRRIARAIVNARAEAPIETTLQLAEIIAKAAPKFGKQKIHPATRSFQALRIYVNRELEELEDALNASKMLLNSGGRLVVVSFHSLEDRIAKHFFTTCSRENLGGSRHLPQVDVADPPLFTLPSRKACLPSEQESASNSRARSAKLRIGIRTENAA